jgi:hypothetical protein
MVWWKVPKLRLKKASWVASWEGAFKYKEKMKFFECFKREGEGRELNRPPTKVTYFGHGEVNT